MRDIPTDIQKAFAFTAYGNSKPSKKRNRPEVGDWVKGLEKTFQGKVLRISRAIALVETSEINPLNGTFMDGPFEIVHMDMIETIEKPQDPEQYKSTSMRFWN